MLELAPALPLFLGGDLWGRASGVVAKPLTDPKSRDASARLKSILFKKALKKACKPIRLDLTRHKTIQVMCFQAKHYCI